MKTYFIEYVKGVHIPALSMMCVLLAAIGYDAGYTNIRPAKAAIYMTCCALLMVGSVAAWLALLSFIDSRYFQEE